MAESSSGSGHLLTLALATLAGWAALTALVVYAGLGARFTLHPDDPSLASPLPQVNLARAETRLGPLEDYAVIGQRPLFNADRLPLPEDAETGSEGADEEAQSQGVEPDHQHGHHNEGGYQRRAFPCQLGGRGLPVITGPVLSECHSLPHCQRALCLTADPCLCMRPLRLNHE